MNGQLRRFLKLNYLLILVAVVLVVTTILFYSGKQSAQDDQTKLEGEVKTAEIRLIQAQQSVDIAPLQQKLADLQSQLSSSSTTYFPQQVPWPELGNNLVASADRHSVLLLSLTPSIGAGTEKFDTRQYAKSTFNLSIEGELEEINAFLNDLGKTPFPKLRVDNLALTTSENSWSAQLTLVILTQS